MAAPAWQKVRRELGRPPIVSGRIGGATPMYVERYVYRTIDRPVSGLSCTGLLVQFGGGPVREGEPEHWRSMNLPAQSLLVPQGMPTHWHYSGTVDFAVFYFLEGAGRTMQSLEALARASAAPVPFSDALVGASALQLVTEFQRGASVDEGFMERLAGVMLEQAFRALTTPGAGGINPRHAHFGRLQAVLGFIHGNLAENLSTAILAARAGVSLAHFCRIFVDATGVPPHRYVLAARLELARKFLGQSSLPISRVAEECGFSSQSHLTASFRAAHSVTPAQYRVHVRTGTA